MKKNTKYEDITKSECSQCFGGYGGDSACNTCEIAERCKTLTRNLDEEETNGEIEMAKVYTCTMTKTLTFNVKANSMEEAQEWCDTHDFIDVQENIGSDSWDMEYCDIVTDIESNGYDAIDISE